MGREDGPERPVGVFRYRVSTARRRSGKPSTNPPRKRVHASDVRLQARGCVSDVIWSSHVSLRCIVARIEHIDPRRETALLCSTEVPPVGPFASSAALFNSDSSVIPLPFRRSIGVLAQFSPTRPRRLASLNSPLGGRARTIALHSSPSRLTRPLRRRSDDWRAGPSGASRPGCRIVTVRDFQELSRRRQPGLNRRPPACKRGTPRRPTLPEIVARPVAEQ